MLVTFTSDAYSDVTMFGDVALAMLKMMGSARPYPVPCWRQMFLRR